VKGYSTYSLYKKEKGNKVDWLRLGGLSLVQFVLMGWPRQTKNIQRRRNESSGRSKEKKNRRVCPTQSGYGFFPDERRTPRLVGSSPSAAREHHDLALLPVVLSQLVEDLPSHRINAGLHGLNDVQP
jgi:hypothetical protein